MVQMDFNGCELILITHNFGHYYIPAHETQIELILLTIFYLIIANSPWYYMYEILILMNLQKKIDLHHLMNEHIEFIANWNCV